MELGGSQQCLLAASQAGLSLGGEGTPQSSWEPTETFQLQAQVLHSHAVDLQLCAWSSSRTMALFRAGLHCCSVLLSVRNVASFI